MPARDSSRHASLRDSLARRIRGARARLRDHRPAGVRPRVGHGGKITNQQGALRTVEQRSFGHVLLALLAIGLGGYALWRLLRAALGHGPEGADQGIERLGALGSGIVYALMCAVAVQILTGPGTSGGNTKKTASDVFGWPAGRWLVGRRRARAGRRRRLPVHPRRAAEVPRRLEDRADAAGRQSRGSRSSARSAMWRAQSSSGSSPSSFSRLPTTTRRTRRSASTARSRSSTTARTARGCSARSPPG